METWKQADYVLVNNDGSYLAKRDFPLFSSHIWDAQKYTIDGAYKKLESFEAQLFNLSIKRV